MEQRQSRRKHGLPDRNVGDFHHRLKKQKLTWLEQAAVKALVDLWYGKASGSATVMLSMVVIPVSALWTGLVGGWHGTLALALVEEVITQGKGFQGFFFFFFG